LFLLVLTLNLLLGFSLPEVDFLVSYFAVVLIVVPTLTSPFVVLKYLGVLARAALVSLFPVVLAATLAYSLLPPTLAPQISLPC
jgi:hypothetical protein